MQIRIIKKHNGLGDTIEAIAKVTGASYIANAISNGSPSVPCTPCAKRKEALNDPNLTINKLLYGTGKDG